MQQFFGYGSLVNANTHAYPQVLPARLAGWRRFWCHTTLRTEVFLSVRPADGDGILGLTAEVPDRDWAALDDRETGYDRHDVTDRVAPGGDDVQVYAVTPSLHTGGRGHILLSYLDVVAQGFLHQFGDDGVAHFFATTDEWHHSVVDDRAAPRYPRHQVLTQAERDRIDAALAALGADVVPNGA